MNSQSLLFRVHSYNTLVCSQLQLYRFAQQRGARHYEFATGYNYYFGGERYLVGEQYFSHSPQLQASNPNLPKTIPNLITQSLSACDPDLRQVLMGNVVLTGGGSLFAGLSERLSNELARNFAHVRIAAFLLIIINIIVTS